MSVQTIWAPPPETGDRKGALCEEAFPASTADAARIEDDSRRIDAGEPDPGVTPADDPVRSVEGRMRGRSILRVAHDLDGGIVQHLPGRCDPRRDDVVIDVPAWNRSAGEEPRAVAGDARGGVGIGEDRECGRPGRVERGVEEESLHRARVVVSEEITPTRVRGLDVVADEIGLREDQLSARIENDAGRRDARASDFPLAAAVPVQKTAQFDPSLAIVAMLPPLPFAAITIGGASRTWPWGETRTARRRGSVPTGSASSSTATSQFDPFQATSGSICPEPSSRIGMGKVSIWFPCASNRAP